MYVLVSVIEKWVVRTYVDNEVPVVTLIPRAYDLFVNLEGM